MLYSFVISQKLLEKYLGICVLIIIEHDIHCMCYKLGLSLLKRQYFSIVLYLNLVYILIQVCMYFLAIFANPPAPIDHNVCHIFPLVPHEPV